MLSHSSTVTIKIFILVQLFFSSSFTTSALFRAFINVQTFLHDSSEKSNWFFRQLYKVTSMLLAYPNENSREIVHAYEGKMCSGRISSSQHCKLCLEQVGGGCEGVAIWQIYTCCRQFCVSRDQCSSGKVGRWGRFWAGRSLTGLHPSCSVYYYPTGTACVKGEQAQINPVTRSPSNAFYTCDRQKELKLLHLVPGNEGVHPAQSLPRTFWKEEHWGTLFTAVDLYR